MLRPDKKNTGLFLALAIKGAGTILQDRGGLNKLVDTASINIGSGKRKMNSIKRDLSTLLSLIKSWAMGEYKGVPRTTLLLSAGAIIYFVNPLDAIPDVIPVTGFLDDATVIGIVIASIKKDIENFRVWESAHTGFCKPVSA